MDRGEDGLLGNGLFLDKVLEIDYDKKVMIVHDTLPTVPSGYEKQSFILDGVIPYIRASIEIGKETYTDWYMFDTGYSGILRINNDLNDNYELSNRTAKAFNPFKKTLILPKMTIGNHDFEELPAVLHPEIGGHTAGVFGNVLLKRFNVILDNRNGAVYLKPNSSMKIPLKRFDRSYFILNAPLLLIIIL